MASPTTQKGNIGQAAVKLAALQKGYFVSVPFEGCAYDLIIDRDGVLSRAQIKYITPTDGVLKIKFDAASGAKRNYQNYNPQNCDALVVYEPIDGNIYWIDSSHFRTGTNATMQLRLEPSKNNQTKNVVWAKDFLDW